MKRRNIFVLFFLLIVKMVSASSNDSISTTYKNGVFTTFCRVHVDASDSVCLEVTKAYDHQMRYNLDGLFNWALKGMNMRMEKKEIIMFNFKSTSFNKETLVLRSTGDIIVPGIITVPNVFVDCKLWSTQENKVNNTVNMNMVKSNGFVKNLSNAFVVRQIKGKGNYFELITDVRFGWFFNIFITKKQYKASMEWRLQRFIHNLRDEAERRENSLSAVKTHGNKQLKNSATKQL